MLLSFRVSNFRSIRDEQELSLLRSTRASRGDAPATSTGSASWDPQVGTVAGIYGANASGKSNVLQALLFMRAAVMDSYREWKPDGRVPIDKFAFDAKSKNEPSLFEVQIRLNKIRYQYGFRVMNERITNEWLYVYPGPRRQVWFERDTTADEEYFFGKNFGGRNRTIAEFTRPNALFVSTAIANNHKQLGPVYHWFNHHLRTATPDDRDSRTNYTLSLSGKKERWAEVARMMRFADLGIEDIRVRHEDIPADARQTLLSVFEAAASGSEKVRVDGVRDADEFIRNISRVVEVAHRSAAVQEPVYLPLANESLGTQVWLALIGPVLRVLGNSDTILIDELDASLHPRLTAEILSLFRDPEKNAKQAQIIFTTHDTALLGTLLNETELQRDQVWFTEKDADGATVLYPLTDFAPRKAENLERGYLQGRYGAIPMLDDRILLSVVRDLNQSSGEVQTGEDD
jgi:AAA15 family ATPase/GTPase